MRHAVLLLTLGSLLPGDCRDFRVSENRTVPLGEAGKGTGTFFRPKRPDK